MAKGDLETQTLSAWKDLVQNPEASTGVFFLFFLSNIMMVATQSCIHL